MTGSGTPSATRRQDELHGCPEGETLWLELAAGLMDRHTAAPFLDHAAQCPRCEARLKAAHASANDAATAGEERLLRQLPSSSAPGRAKLAAQLHCDAGTAPEPRKPPPHHRRWLSHPIFTFGAALAACALVLLGIFLLRKPSDTQLLLQAYNQQRPSELRLEGEPPAPLASPTRGAGVPDMPSRDLLELKLRVQERFDKDPNDPKVRQMLGRIALVQHDGVSARKDFEMAEALRPDLPGLTFDRASAEFEIAETTGQALAYARAIDLYSRYLHTAGGNDPTALFDRGLCWERQAVNTDAIHDFQAALALEHDPGWRKEIQEHLQELQRGTPPASGGQAAAASTGPAVFLARSDEIPGEYERYLGVAGREWLTRRNDPQTHRVLARLAQFGEAHHDAWVRDMLNRPQSPLEIQGDEALAEALRASAQGSADEGLAAARRAASLYQQAADRPGLLRASTEVVYSLQRMGMARQCLQQGEPLAHAPELDRYAWMRSYLQLELAAARGMLGDPEALRAGALAAVAMAGNDALPLAGMRGTSFVVASNVQLEHYELAWEDATAGLRQSEAVPGAAMPRYQLLYGMEDVARALHLDWTLAGLAGAAATAAGETPNRQTAAYAAEDLALDQLRVDENTEAAENFQRADQLLATLDAGPATQRYRADWKVDRALLLATQQSPAAAAQSLLAEEPTYQQPDAFLARVHFYTELADLLRQAQQTPASLKKIQVAVRFLDGQQQHAQNAAGREAWQRGARRTYEVLAADLLQAAEPELALRAWIQFEAASAAPQARTASLAAQSGELSETLPPLPRPGPGSMLLVYTKILNKYVAWSIPANSLEPVRFRTLTNTPAHLEQTAGIFARVCADPKSSTEESSLLGEQLYATLLAPFAGQISGTEQVLLDIDPSLAHLPFAAVQHRGAFLGTQHALVFLAPDWGLGRYREIETARLDRLQEHAQVGLLQEIIPEDAAAIPERYDESVDLASRFPQAHLEHVTLHRQNASVALAGSQHLRSVMTQADLLHYSGHGLEEEFSPAPTVAAQSTVVLPAVPLRQCRIAVLAACRTLHEREESAIDVPSIAHVFLAAGAQHVLATQWDVDSRTTRTLMLDMYRELAEGRRFSEALRRAQYTVASDPATAPPYFWSGFKLIAQ